MEKFEIKFIRTQTHTTKIEVKAKNEKAAWEIAENIGTESDQLCNADWDLDDETLDIEEII